MAPHTAVAEDLSLVPSTHVGHLTTACNSRGSELAALALTAHLYILKKINKKKSF